MKYRMNPIEAIISSLLKYIYDACICILGVPLEEILRRELKGDILGFYQNEVFLNNIESAIRNNDCAKYFQLDR